LYRSLLGTPGGCQGRSRRDSSERVGLRGPLRYNWREPLFYFHSSLFHERRSGRVTPVRQLLGLQFLPRNVPQTHNARVILQASRGCPVALYQVYWSKRDAGVMADMAVFGRTETGKGGPNSRLSVLKQTTYRTVAIHVGLHPRLQ
jgi:hypothetical protein